MSNTRRFQTGDGMNKISKIRQADITQFISSSPMTISRAVNELIQLNLVDEKINGRERILLVDSSMSELNDILQLYLYLHETSIPADKEHLRTVLSEINNRILWRNYSETRTWNSALWTGLLLM